MLRKFLTVYILFFMTAAAITSWEIGGILIFPAIILLVGTAYVQSIGLFLKDPFETVLITLLSLLYGPMSILMWGIGLPARLMPIGENLLAITALIAFLSFLNLLLFKPQLLKDLLFPNQG